MQSYRPTNIKQHNQKFITRILRNHAHPLTKSQLAKNTGLSVVTINKILPEMIENKEIIELETSVATGGRKASVFQINETSHMMLLAQFLESNGQIVISFILANRLGHPLPETKKIMTNISIERFLQWIQDFQKEFATLDTLIIGITGVEINGKLKIMDYLPFLDLNLKEQLARTGITNIVIENDINAASLGFCEEKTDILAGIYFPENFPPGASLIIDHTIFHGKNNLSGEIKHLPNQPYTYPLDTTKISQAVTDALQTLISVYDPEEIICFIPTKWATQLNISETKEQLATVFPYTSLPVITVTDVFEHHYQQGLIQLGLAVFDSM
ncbi:MAG: ROK family protein [Enterococcus sp.]